MADGKDLRIIEPICEPAIVVSIIIVTRL